jgi:hypothetical protein
MNDDELDQAMNELNIEKQYKDESDQEYIEDALAGESQGPGEPSYLDELERLSQLKYDGVITKEEFEAKKKQLLDL